MLVNILDVNNPSKITLLSIDQVHLHYTLTQVNLSTESDVDEDLGMVFNIVNCLCLDLLLC